MDQESTSSLRDAFADMDTSNDGTISLEEFTEGMVKLSGVRVSKEQVRTEQRPHLLYAARTWPASIFVCSPAGRGLHVKPILRLQHELC